MLNFPPNPIPVIVEENKEGYILYVESGGMLNNDIITVVLSESGKIRHYTSKQVIIQKNETFDIKKQ